MPTYSSPAPPANPLLPRCYRLVAPPKPPPGTIATDTGPHNKRASRQRPPPGQEAVMGQAIPRQHPAVVLRSHYQQLRALLAIAMIAVVGLTAAVVILATDDAPDTSAGSATQASTPSPAGSTPAAARGGRPLRRRPRGGNRRAHPALGAGHLRPKLDQEPARRPLRRGPRRGHPRRAVIRRALERHPRPPLRRRPGGRQQGLRPLATHPSERERAPGHEGPVRCATPAEEQSHTRRAAGPRFRFAPTSGRRYWGATRSRSGRNGGVRGRSQRLRVALASVEEQHCRLPLLQVRAMPVLSCRLTAPPVRALG